MRLSRPTRILAVAAVIAATVGTITGVRALRDDPEPAGAARAGLVRNLDFDTCNNSQWGGGPQSAPGRITYPNSGDPTPRQGNGRCMARFELRSGDLAAGGNRAEIYTSAANAGALQGLDRWYGFSVFVPTNNPALTSGYNIFAQWHSPGGNGQSSIILDLGGVIRLYGGCNSTNARASCAQGSTNVGTHPRGRWVDWLLHVRWSSGQDGHLTVFRDGAQIWEDSGPNLYTNGGSYLKVGNYRGGGGTFVLYQDAWRIGTTRADVEPGSAPAPPPAPPPPTPPPPSPPSPPPVPGTVTVSQTLPGGTLSGTVTWRASVTGCTPSRVEFVLDDAIVLTELHSPFGDTEGFWNSNTVGNGEHTFTTRATCPGGVFPGPVATRTVDNTVAESPPPPPQATLEERVADLEARVAALEAAQ